MHIVLLGHDDIASLFAMARLVAARPQHKYRLYVSGAFGVDPSAPAAQAPPPALAELAAADRALCKRFLSGPVPDVLHAAQPLPQPNVAGGLATLVSAAPDLIVSIRYRRILREAAIAVPRLGVLNLHSGILPDYQGVMATFWALLDGAEKLGCTLHRIVDAGIDTGPLIGIAIAPADRRGSYLRQVLALYPGGVDLVIAALDRLAAGRTVPTEPQPRGRGRYYSTPDREALQRFAAAGLKLVDGSEAAWLDAASTQAKTAGKP